MVVHFLVTKWITVQQRKRWIRTRNFTVLLGEDNLIWKHRPGVSSGASLNCGPWLCTNLFYLFVLPTYLLPKLYGNAGSVSHCVYVPSQWNKCFPKVFDYLNELLHTVPFTNLYVSTPVLPVHWYLARSCSKLNSNTLCLGATSH